MIKLTTKENRTLGINLLLLFLSVFCIGVTLLLPSPVTGVCSVLTVIIGLLHHIVYASPVYKRIESAKLDAAIKAEFENRG